MTFSVVKTQLQREFWEHKTGFFYAPVIATLLFLCLFAYVSFSFVESISNGQFTFSGTIDLHSGAGDAYKIKGDDEDAVQKITSLVADVSAGNPEILNIIFGSAVGVNFSILLIVAAIVLAVYNHGCLFDDRKNRDVLFWRSMPVSETTNVLVKLGILLFGFPLIALVLNLVVSVITLVGVSVFVLAKGAAFGSWLVALVKSGALLIAFKLFVSAQVFWLALLPIIGFVLWASAFAKKSPFLLAALLPIGLLVIDKVLQSYAGINLHIISTLSNYGEFLAALADFFDIDKSGEGYKGLLPQLLLAIGIGSLFVVSAIWLRNNRYEI